MPDIRGSSDQQNRLRQMKFTRHEWFINSCVVYLSPDVAHVPTVQCSYIYVWNVHKMQLLKNEQYAAFSFPGQTFSQCNLFLLCSNNKKILKVINIQICCCRAFLFVRLRCNKVAAVFLYLRVWRTLYELVKKTHRNIHRAYSLLIGMRLHVFLFLFAVTVARVIRYPLVH